VGTVVTILSDKSSGSSMLQAALAAHPDAHTVAVTPHHERETLYWSKAVAALGLEQPRMIDSRMVPMSRAAGEEGVRRLLTDNTTRSWPGTVDLDLVFDGWARLAEDLGPFFVEKSPHHLHTWPALDLMVRFAGERSGTPMRFVGLVRDPMDTLYSMWRRWGVLPERRQGEWVRAYRNLIRLGNVAGDRLLVVRYEDLVRDPGAIPRVAEWSGLDPGRLPEPVTRSDSIGRWRRDPRFGFRPDPATARLALELGYATPTLARRPQRVRWRLTREARRASAGVRRGHRALREAVRS